LLSENRGLVESTEEMVYRLVDGLLQGNFFFNSQCKLRLNPIIF